MMKRTDLQPHVFWRLTNNWIEMSLRFIAHESEIRELKDQMSREVIEQFDRASIGIASGTYEIVGVPPIRIETAPAPGRSDKRQPAGSGASAGMTLY